MIECKTFRIKKTGELLVTEDASSPKFWGRLISGKEKAKHIANGTLTLAQTQPMDEPKAEEPLKAPNNIDEIDESEGVRALKLPKGPGISVISQIDIAAKKQNETPLVSPEIFEANKGADDGPLEAPSVW